MESKIRSRIKKAFYTYPKVMAEAVTSTVEWAESNFAVNYEKVCVQATQSNHKETQLCKLIDSNLSKMRWCYVIEKVLDHFKFDRDKIQFIQEYYFERKGENYTCVNVGISRRTLFRWQEEILDIAYKWAVELNVL